ncbi:hypothetical protein [Maricaulis sp.]|jgi:hypothetical protein|uniref:hypothetical protein n=1 Tax=Maricaulis sp. TaxID=1486257 RepID=UPI0026135371|nr:hypothetical protein [Maricaulis sp.]
MADDADTDAPQADARRPGRAGTVLAIAGVLALGGWLGWRYLDRPPDDLWQAATVPYDPECSEGCEVFRDQIPAGHGGRYDAQLTLLVDPDLDDPIAQWSDCVDSVFTCLGTDAPRDDAGRAGHLRGCVAQSACPDPCRQRYASRSGGGLDGAVEAFGTIFLEEDAWCAPRQ